jgi:subtilisin family serine protease
MKYLAHYSLVLTILLLNACGGSSSNSNQTPPADENSSELLAKNEPYYKYSWHIDSKNSILNSKGYAIDANADIHIIEAWKLTEGEGVKVAVIDDAFDVNHEDLKDNIYIAYNVDNNTNDVSNKYPINNEYGTSHGNTCAGFIVAPINGKGIVGTAPKSKLIAIKLEGETDSIVIKAFEYAKNQGAQVISCSWGTENMSDSIDAELKSLYDANITVLFASGNDGKNLDDAGIRDESESKWVLGVSASGENNDVTSYSNYGKELDILAPGGDHLDSIGVLGIDDSGERGSHNQHGMVSEDYAFTSGTSFSSPIAAGVVALMYSINPNITPIQVRDILIHNSDKIGGNDAAYIDGFDEKRAYGKINALKAVNAAKALLGV